jgi:uncharacterized protein with PhoU and TrkA domain
VIAILSLLVVIFVSILITRVATYVGNPVGETAIHHGDGLVLYGRISAIQELDQRKRGYRGDREHREAMEEQQEVVEEEIKQDTGAGEDSGTTLRSP